MASSLKWTDLELMQPLGEGHAAIVWRARLKRRFREFSEGSAVAVKRYKSWLFDEAGQYDRIIRELETGLTVEHPCLMRTLCLVADPEHLPALVMPYYKGRTLEAYLASCRRLRKPTLIRSALRIVGRLAGALGALHRVGIIHRDVKPANVIVDGDSPILMDLGVVRTNRLPEQSTTTQFLGTIRYASPEYLFGEKYNYRADVYSLGAIAYELFSNRQFFGTSGRA